MQKEDSIVLDGLETSEEIEEVRELLYNLLKNFQTGVTSTFLEEQYNRKLDFKQF